MFAHELPATLLAATSDPWIHVWWYLGRAAGFTAFWLLFASVAMGLAVSSRVFDGMLARPWVFEFHKFLSILVLLAMGFHGLIMIPDPYAKFTFRQMLIPFESHYRTNAVALGIVAFYASIFITATFYLKGLIGQNGWRLIHYTTFALFVMALAHGLWAGTDTKKAFVQYSYLASAAAVLFLTFFRILASRSAARRAPRTAPAPQAKAA